MKIFEDTGLTIRDDLKTAHTRAWESISRAGTWLTGERRVAVSAEVRNALTCDYCRAQKEALSPNAVEGKHTGLGDLSAAEVQAVHRITSDPGRLSEDWYQSIISQGLSPEEYIELAGQVAITMVADTFTFGIGAADHPLPAPQGGEPTCYRPPGAKKDAAWVPITEPDDAVEEDGDLYRSNKVAYIQRALSGVPDTKRDYWQIAEAHYLPNGAVRDFEIDLRAISRPQIEVIAARVSALHQCLY